MKTQQKHSFRRLVDGTDNAQVVFRPSPEFYKATGIGRKRWGQIYRAEKPPLLTEIKSIAAYLKIPVGKFLE